MQRTRRTGVILATAAALLVPAAARAQLTNDGSDRVSDAQAQALANVQINRSTVIRETVDRWRSQFQPFDAARNIGGEDERLTAALQNASAEKLLAASQAQTYEDLLKAVQGRWRGPSVIPLEPGPIPNALGDAAADLVFTPVTPCRIIDTRSATGLLAGRIGPNLGKQFSVSLTDYSAQGGFAGSCGIPIAPAGVAINVTSVDQTGQGNLRVVPTGAGIPTVSLVNYNAGINIANAAAVASAGTLGSDNIFIYSGNSASSVVVDIMGYYAAPLATPVENVKVSSTYISIAAGATGSTQSPACPAGYTITGGGGGFPTSSSANTSVLFLFPFGANGAPFSTYNCGGWNGSASAVQFACVSVCSRVPGR